MNNEQLHRLAFKMKLFKGFEKEYARRHAEIWPELQELLRSKGILDYSIFLDELTGDLFAVFKADDEKKLDELPQEPVMKKWWAFMKDIMETNPDQSPVATRLEEVFYMD